MWFIRLMFVYVGTVQKQICTRNIVGVETAKCHMVTERCTRQLALTAEKNAMFLSSQTAQDQYIAASATQKDAHQEDTKRKLMHLSN
jgi:hypothetical protein